MSAWEEMVQQVVVDGHPGKVRSAAANWQALLDNLRSIKESLESNVTDLGQTWKGPAYETFRQNIEGQAKLIGRIIEDAEKGEGIVQSLNAAADRLAQAQADMPVPYAALDDVLRAREANLVLDVGLFEARVSADFLSLPPVEWTAKLMDWLNDKTAEARAVYERVNNEFQGKAPTMPGESTPLDSFELKPETPDLRSGPGAGSVSGMSGGSGGAPGIGSPGGVDVPKYQPFGGIPNTPYDDNPGSPPGFGGTYDPGSPPGFGDTYDSGSPPDFDDNYGSGLAGATPNVGGGGFGGGGIGGGVGGGIGGIGSGSGLGGAGGGFGGAGGNPPGGGALGRPVTPGFLPGLMGGMGGGAGSAARRGAGGLGSGRGGTAALGGAGRGVGSGLGAAARAAGVGARGTGGMAAMGGLGGYGTGFGEREHDRTSWLQEDDDVWGAEGDAPPGVLR
jgi:hypothetical protein